MELNYEELSLEQILRDYGNRTGLAFSYSSNTVSLGHKYTIVGRAENREEGVGLICAEAKLEYKFLGNMVVLKQKLKPAIKKRVPESVPVNKEEEMIIYLNNEFVCSSTMQQYSLKITFPFG